MISADGHRQCFNPTLTTLMTMLKSLGSGARRTSSTSIQMQSWGNSTSSHAGHEHCVIQECTVNFFSITDSVPFETSLFQVFGDVQSIGLFLEKIQLVCLRVLYRDILRQRFTCKFYSCFVFYISGAVRTVLSSLNNCQK